MSTNPYTPDRVFDWTEQHRIWQEGYDAALANGEALRGLAEAHYDDPKWNMGAHHALLSAAEVLDQLLRTECTCTGPSHRDTCSLWELPV